MGAVSEAVIEAALAACAAVYPMVERVPPHRMIQHIIVESGMQQFSVGVNATADLPHESRTFQVEASAIAFVRQKLAEGRRVDAGLSGLTDRPSQRAEPASQWARYDLSPETVFDIEANVCAGARILAAGYQRAIERMAACDYNTGRLDCRSPTGTNGYPERVDQARAPAQPRQVLAVIPRARPPPAVPMTPPPFDLFERHGGEQPTEQENE